MSKKELKDSDEIELKIPKTGETLKVKWGDLKKGLDYFIKIQDEVTVQEEYEQLQKTGKRIK